MERKTPELKPLFIERMQKLLPDKKDYQDYLNILKIPPAKSIRCNILKISPEKLKKRLEEKNWKISQPWKFNPEIMIVEGKFRKKEGVINNKAQNDISLTTKGGDRSGRRMKLMHKTNEDSLLTEKGGSERSELSGGDKRAKRDKLVDLKPGELGRALEHLLGYYYIQELASMLPVIVLSPKENELILDLCAAPGSKTSQIAAKIKNTGTIIANEISLGRLKILASNLERCGITNTLITKKEGSALCNKLNKEKMQFNRILVDVPCSGEGTLRSSYKTYSMWNIKTIKNLPKIQLELFSSAFEILKPKGEIIYSTCTHAPEENEGVVNSILKKFGNKIKLEKINLPIKYREGLAKWEGEEYSKKIKKCARIYPQDNNTEGFFIAKFQRIK